MSAPAAQVVVAGHICLDIIPTLEQRQSSIESLLQPGKLVKIGPAVISTGGAVSNTGLALHRLGIPTRLMGKVGDDALGQTILDVLQRHSPALADGMIISPGEPSSYTVVISPPGVDRMFLHCPGVNDTFQASDVNYAKLTGSRLFHFGYPPIMRRMYLNNGAELETMFRRVKQQGLITTLDMTMPDPQSEAGQLDWAALLLRVLPHVDVFLPSLDEMLLMLRQHPDEITGETLSSLAEHLLSFGAKTVVLKLGDQGLYVRNADHELIAPCFQVNVVGATGSGDCTIAGFIAGLMKNLSLEETLTAAVAVGACCCEAADATSGVPSWETVQQRITTGWPRRLITLPLPRWREDTRTGLRLGPANRN